jgi:hypothetical protein
MSAPVTTPRLIGDFFLTRDERTSPVWASVRGHLQRMLEEKRTANDNPKLTDVETATLRGHIQLLKAFLALGNEPPESVASGARPRPRIDLGAKYG